MRVPAWPGLVLGTRADEGEALVWVAVAVGLTFCVIPATYRWGRHAVTAIHEAGHAVVALLVGRRLHSIRLHRDSSGETVSMGRSGGPGVVATLVAGYPAPSLVGLSGVWAERRGHLEGWVLVLIIVLAAALILLRNVFGVVVMSAVLMGLWALHRWADPRQAGAACLLISAFLLGGGLRGALELFGHRAPNDAASLARSTPLPASVWKVLFVAAAAAALLAAVGVLGVKPPGTWWERSRA